MAFHGNTVLISGGASGMGQLHASRLAQSGAQVAILDLNEAGLEETAKLSKNIRAFHCDVTNLEEVVKIVEQVEAEMGAIDRLINCAAIMPGGLLKDTSAEFINKIMLINYGGMVNICQTVVPKMVARNRGDVIIYGSTAGIIPVSRFAAYGASKAANNFYAKVLIEENKRFNLRIQLVCPPAVDTPLINQAKENGPHFLRNIQKTRKNLVSPEMVVESVEKCLEAGTTINYPGSAKRLDLMYRFFPKLLTRIVK